MGHSPQSFTGSDVDIWACEFLRSSYAGPIYADWSVDRRLDAFLRRQGFPRVADNGDLSNLVLDRIMAFGGTAPRDGQDMVDGRPRAPSRFTESGSRRSP